MGEVIVVRSTNGVVDNGETRPPQPRGWGLSRALSFATLASPPPTAFLRDRYTCQMEGCGRL